MIQQVMADVSQKMAFLAYSFVLRVLICVPTQITIEMELQQANMEDNILDVFNPT